MGSFSRGGVRRKEKTEKGRIREMKGKKTKGTKIEVWKPKKIRNVKQKKMILL